MSAGNRRKSNANIRVILEGMLGPVEPGTTIQSDAIAKTLQEWDHRLDMTPTRAACLIRERGDFRCVRTGVWEKVPVLKEDGVTA